jgi:hypothetical protein
MEKQIPFGDDNQNGKSKGNGNDRSNSNDKCKCDGWLAVYFPTLGAKSAAKMGHPAVVDDWKTNKANTAVLRFAQNDNFSR